MGLGHDHADHLATTSFSGPESGGAGSIGLDRHTSPAEQPDGEAPPADPVADAKMAKAKGGEVKSMTSNKNYYLNVSLIDID